MPMQCKLKQTEITGQAPDYCQRKSYINLAKHIKCMHSIDKKDK